MEISSPTSQPSELLGLSSALPIQTSRLTLRPFELTDADALYALQRDKSVTRYAGGAKTRAESGESLRRIIDRTADGGFGPLALQERASSAVIGWCGVQLMRGTGQYEVIYALQVAQWGKGLASEAAKKLLGIAFRLVEPGIEEIFALVYPQNLKSILVLKRLGMVFVEKRDDSVSRRSVSLYGILRDTFLKRQGRLAEPVDQLSSSK